MMLWPDASNVAIQSSALGRALIGALKEITEDILVISTLLKANLDLQPRNRPPLRDFPENCYGPSASSSRRIRYTLILGQVHCITCFQSRFKAIRLLTELFVEVEMLWKQTIRCTSLARSLPRQEPPFPFYAGPGGWIDVADGK
jgi:hypothetical protein